MDNTNHKSDLRILVVDDQSNQRLLAVEILQRGGFDVLEADSGASALDILIQQDVAALVVDVTMPDLDGFELCRRVRAEPRNRHLPIMVMTARDDENAIEEAYNAGATDFISKPVNALLLNHRVRYMLRGAETLDELRRNETLLGLAEDVALSGSWELRAGDELRCSRGFARLFDLQAYDESMEQFLRCFPTSLTERIRELTHGRESLDLPLTAEHSRENADGTLRHFETRVDRRDDLSGHTVVCGVTQDVTQRRAAEAEILQLAYFDKLTGLPNRVMFIEQVRRLISNAARNNEHFALLHVDVDDFKRVNELAGRETGDRILSQVSRRIVQTLRSGDLIARTGDAASDETVTEAFARIAGDEFIVALASLRDVGNVESVSRRLLLAMQEPYLIEGRTYQISASVGIAMYPDHGVDVETLLKNAEWAVSEAKKSGKNRTQVFSREFHDRVVERLLIRNDLRRALDKGDIEVFYQPRVNIPRDQVVGMEALLRWRRNGEYLSAGKFIPVAEESDLIDALGTFVLERASEQTMRLVADGLPALELGVNLSARQLESPRLIEDVEKALEATGMAPSNLCFELTESALMHHADQNVNVLQSLRELGCKLAIDDFGTGYSSLNYLKRFPIDTLKIDRSFVIDLESNHEDGKIVTAVVRLAQTLGLNVVAEGVETRNQEMILKRLGCDEIQGFLYSAPLPYGEFATWLRRRLATSTILRATI